MNFTKQYSVYLTYTTVDAKEQSICLSFDWDVYWLYKQHFCSIFFSYRLLQTVDLEGKINSFRFTGPFLLFNSKVQNTSVLTKWALCQANTEQDDERQSIE